MSTFVEQFEETKSSNLKANNSCNFFNNKFPSPDIDLLNSFQNSSKVSKDSMKRNEYNHYKGDPSSCPVCLCERCEGWKLDQCADCKRDLGPARLAKEEDQAQIAMKEDKTQALLHPHVDSLHSLGIKITALIAFACVHDCWGWPVWRVVRDVVVPTTSASRCRYGDLPEVKHLFGPATIFMSHCWSASFGDLIGAACHGAREDRVVWIDIFAVRQWPGNVADLDFRSVIKRCKAMIVSVSPVKGLQEWMEEKYERDAFLSSPAGIKAKSMLPSFRLWCVVELAAAIDSQIPVIVKGGGIKIEINDGATIYIYETETNSMINILSNISNMIDVESSECAVPADHIREMNTVHGLKGGVEHVNKVVEGVFGAASNSIANTVTEVDAALCGETEALLKLKMRICSGNNTEKELAMHVLNAACSGSRVHIVRMLLDMWLAEIHTNQEVVQKEMARPKYLSLKEESDRTNKVQSSDSFKQLLKILKTQKSSEISLALEALKEAGGGRELNDTACILLKHHQHEDKEVRENRADGEVKIDSKEVSFPNSRMLVHLIDDSKAVYFASATGDVDVLHILLEINGVNPNVSISDGKMTALYQACFEGHLNVVQVLLASDDIDVNQPDTDDETTPLYVACKNGHISIVELLIGKKHINMNHPDEDGNPPIVAALENNHHEIVDLLTAAGAHPPPPPFQRGNKEDIGIHTDKKCINGHGLIRFTVSTKQLCCEECYDFPPKLNQMYGCDECDYDLCMSCHNN